MSDSVAAGTRTDLSGPAVIKALQSSGYDVAESQVVGDHQREIEASILESAKVAELVVTTGGTGIAAADVTPEATRAVCTKLLEGVAEEMRRAGRESTPLASLSRGVCGVCGTSLVLNLPGHPKAAVESLRSVLHLFPHALDLLRGNTAHKP